MRSEACNNDNHLKCAGRWTFKGLSPDLVCDCVCHKSYPVESEDNATKPSGMWYVVENVENRLFLGANDRWMLYDDAFVYDTFNSALKASKHLTPITRIKIVTTLPARYREEHNMQCQYRPEISAGRANIQRPVPICPKTAEKDYMFQVSGRTIKVCSTHYNVLTNRNERDNRLAKEAANNLAQIKAKSELFNLYHVETDNFVDLLAAIREANSRILRRGN